MSILKVSDLSSGYGSHKVLERLAFSVEQGELVGLLGENGSGKSTLLKALSGIRKYSGNAEIEGENGSGCAVGSLKVRELARLISYVPQKNEISADLSVLDIVLWGFNPELGLAEKPRKEMRERALGALASVGLGTEADRGFMTLSEGQKQAAIFARVLAARRKLCLLDEPESALDFERRYELLGLLRDSLRERGAGALAALHDPQLALSVCDRLLILKNGEIRAELKPFSEALGETEKKLRLLYPSAALTEVRTKDGSIRRVFYREESV